MSVSQFLEGNVAALQAWEESLLRALASPVAGSAKRTSLGFREVGWRGSASHGRASGRRKSAVHSAQGRRIAVDKGLEVES